MLVFQREKRSQSNPYISHWGCQTLVEKTDIEDDAYAVRPKIERWGKL